MFEQVFWQVVVNPQLPRIYDAHVHTRLDGVVQKHRVNGLSDGFIAPKRKRHVRHAAAYFGVGQMGFYPARGVNKINGVVVVFFNARADGQNVGVKNNILWFEPHLIDQNPVGAFADLNSTFVVIGLALLIKGHHHHRRAVAFHFLGRFYKFFFAFFQRNRVHDALALHAFQTRFDDLPFRGVNHKRHAGNVWLGHEQITEPIHGHHAVNHALVEVNINDLRAILDLLPRHGQCRVVVAFPNQTGKFLRTCYVATLTYVYKFDIFGHVKRL